METVRVDLAERSYDIHIGQRLLDSLGGWMKETLRGRQVMIAYDEALASPWMKIVFKTVSDAGFDVLTAPIPTGEPSKCTAELARLWDRMAEANFTRDAAMIALGGGVTGDLVGFAAASFLRGIDFVQIPTSLLAMVDSSVGGKTGINLESGKNLVGAFWQPRLVVADLDCLGTLSEAERNSGMAEVIKYGVIRDAEFFAFLEENIENVFDPGNADKLTHVVKRSVEIKADVVANDEREGGLRRILNFGHTIGHAIEAEGHYRDFRHGEAIAIGMVAASLLTVRRAPEGWTATEHDRLVRLIERANLPVRLPAGYSAQALLDRTRVDKKALGGTVRYVLPTRMGHVETVKDVSDEAVVAVCKELGAE